MFNELRARINVIKLFFWIVPLAILTVVPIITDNVYVIHILILANVYVVFASSWDLISGYTGQVSLGHALFFGGGGYLTALLTMRLGVSPPLCLLIAGISMAGLSLVVGVPCLRLSGPYLAIATLAFAEVVRSLVIAFPHITRGDEGIPLTYLVRGIVPNYYISLVLMVSMVGAMYLIANRYFRVPFIAIRENEAVAKASGINTARYRLLAFTLSAFFSGVIGSFYALYAMAVTPHELSIDMSILPLTMSIVGGMGTITGPVLGAYALTILTEALRALIYKVRILIYALLLVIFVILMPGGIIKALSDLVKTYKARFASLRA
ncbi:MAG: branched-chain amino acid ABC transporter permease [Candidatus Nezhaarchaeota archaeon]|nr:branched-chain amino acid ABC transporter permease [Candidatus Nezhaarchaeota archaeon]